MLLRLLVWLMEKEAEFIGDTKLVAGASDIMLLIRSLMLESILLGSLPLLMPTFLSGVLGSFDSASTMSNELDVDLAFCELYYTLTEVVRYEAFLRFSFELMFAISDSFFFVFEELLMSGMKVTSSSKSEKLMVSFIPLLGIGVF